MSSNTPHTTTAVAGKQAASSDAIITESQDNLVIWVDKFLTNDAVSIQEMVVNITNINNALCTLKEDKAWKMGLSRSVLFTHQEFFQRLTIDEVGDDIPAQDMAKKILAVMKEYFVEPLVASNRGKTPKDGGPGKIAEKAAHVSRVNNRFVATRAGLSAGAAGALAFPNVGGGDGDERSGEARVEAEAVSPAKRQRTEVAEDGFASALGELVSQRVSQLDFGFIMGRAEIVSRIDAAVEGRVAELVGGDVITGAVRSAVSKGVAEALRSEESRVSTRVGELVAHGLRPEAVESAVEQSIGSAVRKIVAETLRAKFT